MNKISWGRPVVALTSALGLCAWMSACGGGGGDNAADPVTTPAAATQDVSVQFAAVVGSSGPVDCGSTLTGLGSHASAAQLKDLRFYLSNVRLVSSSGAEVPITLAQNDFQQGAGLNSVVLIDLTDIATGACASTGTDGSAETNAVIVGKVPPGTYTGFRATVGLPDSLNHSDTMASAAPLDNMAMGWSWQNGRKFIKLELNPVGGVSDGAGSEATYNVHVASTDCSGGNVATAICTHANMVSIDIPLNPSSQQVALDLNEVFRGVDLSTNAVAAVGCMSAVTDTDCGTLFNNLGLNLSTGTNQGAQAVFRAVAK
jgi:uncharacterized repeat protein (TIGR04052 family)